MPLQGSICVVTGATEGIGKAVSLALGAAGARLAICARTSRAVKETVLELQAQGITTIGHTTDVSQEKDVRRFAEFVRDELGRPRVLINNAGLGYFAGIEQLSVKQFDETMAVNVRGIFLMTRAFLPDLRKGGGGDIVNIASLAGRTGMQGGTAYNTSKHAVLGFSRSLMLEVRQDNIRVIAVCPGSVVTEFFEKAGHELPNADRVLTAEDVAQTVVAALELPRRAMISELDLRPTNP